MQSARALLWTGIEHFSSEHLSIVHRANQWRIEGRVITTFDDAPAFITYSLSCTNTWHTHHAAITCETGDRELALALSCADGVWTVDGRLRPDLTGCIDIDLEITPFTNTLPINRLGLGVGEHASVRAAWVRFPDLTMEPSIQQYTRVAPHRYRFESELAFRADLEVDDDGIVVVYEHLWEQPPFKHSPRG